MKKPFIVGITGGSASGKTLFLERLLSSFETDEVCLISQDNYYKPRHLQPIDAQGVHNFDTPHSIDFEQYAADIRKIQDGETVLREEYTFNNAAKTPKILSFASAPVVVVEGIFVLYYPELADLLDLKIFIDAKDHIKLKRRIIRDKIERGYDLDDVLYRYEMHVMPTYEKYIKPFKNEADLIVPNNSSFDMALDVIRTYLRAKSGK
ncbi:uridine kinase [Algoriphagus alkaliphilus]|jgi:uridine kinase|uniref:uridine/cytidine kinase n=1 Tax=Algoriphagus alkaliphilus TaxID=279824 RepID=A0A1G5YER8_9BACT|nr:MULTISPECIES: uridine kinase [Algoriphagus]MBA4298518.1 uridine kinase [Cyclobacterium sp.]MDO8965670.1 uridine kinase [Algoriphagus sp.]MDP2042680.1 uridine kinase [Algoriphagus sp.]MDP3200493.1 uridine kinase [Algoriphagus sp.]MDP3470316.1 uridine kinase [Algoriphagus sp.]